MYPEALSRRTFMKLAIGSVAIVGSSGFVNPLHAQFMKSGSSDYSDLVSRYLGPIKDEAAAQSILIEIEALSSEEYLAFYELAAAKVAEMAASNEPDVKSKTLAAFADQKRLMTASLKKYGRPYNKLTPLEKTQIAESKASSELNMLVGGKGKGLARPHMAPCYTYTYNAYLSFLPGYPNYINYYAAAGYPSCGDVDLEIQYGNFCSTMYFWTTAGSAYMTALRAQGKLQVLRNFGSTGALVGNGYVNTFFFGSSYYAANSLAMS